VFALPPPADTCVTFQITEIEGESLLHESLVYAPILQLLISSDDEAGRKITKITTLSVNGEAPVETLPAPPAVPYVGDADADADSSFSDRLGQLLGYGSSCHSGACVKLRNARVGQAGAGRTPNFHPKSRKSCMRRRFGSGLAYLRAVLVAFFSLLPVQIFTAVLVSGVFFHAVRRLVVRRRSYERVRLEDDDVDEGPTEIFDKDKEAAAFEVVVEEHHDLPAYEEQATQTSK
jgi:hypothetical protein